MVLTDTQIEEHTYRLVAVSVGSSNQVEHEIYECTKPGCTHQKVEEVRHED